MTLARDRAQAKWRRENRDKQQSYHRKYMIGKKQIIISEELYTAISLEFSGTGVTSLNEMLTDLLSHLLKKHAVTIKTLRDAHQEYE